VVVLANLSREEEIHLYNLSLIPAGVIVAVFWILFIYLMHINELKTVWDTMFFAAPFWTLIVGTVFFTFEVLYGRRTQTPLKSHAKRLVGRISLLLVGMSSFLAFFGLAYLALSPFIGDYAILYSGVIWLVILLVIYRSFKETVDNFIEGRW